MDISYKVGCSAYNYGEISPSQISGSAHPSASSLIWDLDKGPKNFGSEQLMANLVGSLKQIFCKNICPLRPSGLSILPVPYLSIPSLSNTGPLLPSPPFSLNLNSPLVLICHVVRVPILDRMPFEKPKVDEHLEHHSCGHPQYCTILYKLSGVLPALKFLLGLRVGIPTKNPG